MLFTKMPYRGFGGISSRSESSNLYLLGKSELSARISLSPEGPASWPGRTGRQGFKDACYLLSLTYLAFRFSEAEILRLPDPP